MHHSIEDISRYYKSFTIIRSFWMDNMKIFQVQKNFLIGQRTLGKLPVTNSRPPKIEWSNLELISSINRVNLLLSFF